VINLRAPWELRWDERSAVEALGMSYYNVPVTGRSFDPKAFARVEELVSQNRGKEILIHCASSTRAGGWLATHLVRERGMSVDDALAVGRRTGISNWGTYLPFWNTAILLTSSVTVHFAHTAIKNLERTKLLIWLGLTVALGIVFLFLQVEEYLVAYQELGLTLSSGIYGSTFFLLTGFHGFHVTLGTFMLLVQLIRAFRGHFQPKDCFGFEASSWYWHFVDVVWVCLFLFVYVF
jgi:heme/copper-type cytochrome/quinol oxidase subunit 3